MHRLTGWQAGRGAGRSLRESLVLRKKRKSTARSWAEWIVALAESRSRGSVSEGQGSVLQQAQVSAAVSKPISKLEEQENV